jgi:hypothetical protein
MLGAIPSLPQYAFMAWCLVKHRDNFTFTSWLLYALPFSDFTSIQNELENTAITDCDLT